MSLDVEALAHQVCIELGRVGRNGKVAIAFSHTSGRFVTIRSNDYRYEDLEANPDYELLGNWDYRNPPRLRDLQDDITAFIEEEKSKTTGVRPELFEINE